MKELRRDSCIRHGKKGFHCDACFKERIAQLESKLTTLTSALRMTEEALDNYGQHEKDCLCAQYQAGRPTADGGYETLFGFGKDERWYQKGEWPNCSCGYTDVITKIREVFSNGT